MKSCLNIDISYFSNKVDKTPIYRNLLAVLQSTDRTEAVINGRTILAQQGEAAYRLFKENQPCYLISVTCEGGHGADCIVGRTGLFGFDIDDLGGAKNPDWTPEEIKECLAQCKNVAYCALSLSGNGVFGIIPIAQPEHHAQYFDALKHLFIEIGLWWKGKPIVIDKSCGNPNRLRFDSYDANPVWRHDAEPLIVQGEPTKAAVKSFDYTPDAEQDRQRVEVCINEIVRQGTYLGDAYEDWYTIGCALVNSFGESGRDYFHYISQNYPGYDANQTDKQFAACLRANSKATLGSFFHLCQQIGIEWKVLIPYVVQERQAPTHSANPPKKITTYFTRQFIPFPPLVWDAAQTRAFIHSAVIPDGYDEQDWPLRTTASIPL